MYGQGLPLPCWAAAIRSYEACPCPVGRLQFALMRLAPALLESAILSKWCIMASSMVCFKCMVKDLRFSMPLKSTTWTCQPSHTCGTGAASYVPGYSNSRKMLSNTILISSLSEALWPTRALPLSSGRIFYRQSHRCTPQRVWWSHHKINREIAKSTILLQV
jgi:hypothetical protein